MAGGGYPAIPFTDQLERDTKLVQQELPIIMSDREEWRKLITSAH